jgi:hypothetical protein
MPNVKVIKNFKTFPESINTPSSDQQFRNFGHWKLGEVLVLDRSAIWTILGFKPISNGNLKKP